LSAVRKLNFSKHFADFCKEHTIWREKLRRFIGFVLIFFIFSKIVSGATYFQKVVHQKLLGFERVLFKFTGNFRFEQVGAKGTSVFTIVGVNSLPPEKLLKFQDTLIRLIRFSRLSEDSVRAYIKTKRNVYIKGFKIGKYLIIIFSSTPLVRPQKEYIGDLIRPSSAILFKKKYQILKSVSYRYNILKNIGIVTCAFDVTPVFQKIEADEKLIIIFPDTKIQLKNKLSPKMVGPVNYITVNIEETSSKVVIGHSKLYKPSCKVREHTLEVFFTPVPGKKAEKLKQEKIKQAIEIFKKARRKLELKKVKKKDIEDFKHQTKSASCKSKEIKKAFVNLKKIKQMREKSRKGTGESGKEQKVKVIKRYKDKAIAKKVAQKRRIKFEKEFRKFKESIKFEKPTVIEAITMTEFQKYYEIKIKSNNRMRFVIFKSDKGLIIKTDAVKVNFPLKFRLAGAMPVDVRIVEGNIGKDVIFNFPDIFERAVYQKNNEVYIKIFKKGNIQIYKKKRKTLKIQAKVTPLKKVEDKLPEKKKEVSVLKPESLKVKIGLVKIVKYEEHHEILIGASSKLNFHVIETPFQIVVNIENAEYTGKQKAFYIYEDPVRLVRVIDAQITVRIVIVLTEQARMKVKQVDRGILVKVFKGPKIDVQLEKVARRIKLKQRRIRKARILKEKQKVKQVEVGETVAGFTVSPYDIRRDLPAGELIKLSLLSAKKKKEAMDHYLNGKASEARYDYIKAVDEYRAALKLQPYNVSFIRALNRVLPKSQVQRYVEKAKEFVLKDDWAKAVWAYEEALSREPNNPKIRYALSEARKMLSLKEDMERGIVYFENQRYEDAIKLFAKVIYFKRDYIPAYVYLARCYEHKHFYEKAVDYYTRALKFAPYDKEIRTALSIARRKVRIYKLYKEGREYENQGKYDLAIANYEEALRLERKLKKDEEAAIANFIDTGLRLLMNDEINKALNIFRAAIKMAPDSVKSHYWYARALMAAGRVADAVAEFKKVIKLDPTNKVKLTDLLNVGNVPVIKSQEIKEKKKAVEEMDEELIDADVLLKESKSKDYELEKERKRQEKPNIPVQKADKEKEETDIFGEEEILLKE